MEKFPNLSQQEPIYETPDIKPIDCKLKTKRRRYRKSSWAASLSFHIALMMAFLPFRISINPGEDYIISEAERPETPLETLVEFEKPPIEPADTSYLDPRHLLEQLPDVVIKPPEETLNKKPEELTSKDIEEIIYATEEKISKTPAIELASALPALARADKWLVREKSSKEIDQVRRNFSGLTGKKTKYDLVTRVATLNEIDLSDEGNATLGTRIVDEGEKWFEELLIRPNGDYEVNFSYPFSRTGKFERTLIEKSMQKGLPYGLKELRNKIPHAGLKSAMYRRHFKPEGKCRQGYWVEKDTGKYCIISQTPVSEKTSEENQKYTNQNLLEGAFDLLNKNPRHKGYLDTAREIANDILKKQNQNR